jgi:hypothetical protein
LSHKLTYLFDSPGLFLLAISKLLFLYFYNIVFKFLANKMNFSRPLYEPTHMTWMIEKSCKCPKPNNVCIRPITFGKPVMCVHEMYATNFHHFLETAPDNNNEWMLMAILALLVLQLLMKVKSLHFKGKALAKL